MFSGNCHSPRSCSSFYVIKQNIYFVVFLYMIPFCAKKSNRNFLLYRRQLLSQIQHLHNTKQLFINFFCPFAFLFTLFWQSSSAANHSPKPDPHPRPFLKNKQNLSFVSLWCQNLKQKQHWPSCFLHHAKFLFRSSRALLGIFWNKNNDSCEIPPRMEVKSLVNRHSSRSETRSQTA